MANAAARVIVCKLNRFGDLKKILDKNPLNNEQQKQNIRPKLSANRAKKAGICNASTTISTTAPFLHSLLTSSNEASDFNSVDGDEQIELFEGGKAQKTRNFVSELQLINSEGGFVLDDILKDSIISLRVGDAVRLN